MENKVLYRSNNEWGRNLYEGYYKHFKEKYYYVYGVVEHTETGETMVLYKALYGERKLYVRPISMFLSVVDKEKYPEVEQEFRFEHVSEDEYKSYELSNRDCEVVTLGEMNYDPVTMLRNGIYFKDMSNVNYVARRVIEK